MKPIKAFGVLAALGGLLVTLNLGGVAGCGDSTGTGGGGGSTDSDIAAISAAFSLSSIAANSDDETALRVAGLALKAQTDIDVCVTGTETISDTAGGASIVFDNCETDDGTIIDGTMSVDSDSDGTEPFISTITFEDVDIQDPDCGDFTIGGDVTVSVFLDGTGTIDYALNISGPDGDFSVDCTLPLDFTCPDFVAECGGATETEICIGDEFVTDISCE